MNIALFIQKLRETPEKIEFSDTMATIDAAYDFTPTSFSNGELVNAAGQNSGSCKLFAFARLHELQEQQTLDCFGSYYREEVVKNPQGENHQNIRNFMKTGWVGLKFSDTPLKLR